MENENKEQIKEIESKTLAIEEKETKIDVVAENIALMESERLMAKRKELADTEARVDRKLAEIKRFLENTELGGRALAGQSAVKPETAKEYKDRIMRGG